MGFLDFVFPKRCVNCKKFGSYLCENCFAKLSFDAKSLCLICSKVSYNNLTHPACMNKYSIDGCFSAISYKGVAKRIIYSFKNRPYITNLKNILIELFYESIIQNENFVNLLYKEKFVLVPIPLFSSKFRKRGYNQSEILAKALSKKLKIPVANLLEKTTEAFKTAKNANSLNILLIDDILVTGATLKEAAKILKQSGAKKVFGLTLARD